MWVTWGRSGSRRTRAVSRTTDAKPPEALALGDAVAFQERLGRGKFDRYPGAPSRVPGTLDDAPHLRWRSPKSFALGGSLYAVEVVGEPADGVARRLVERGIITRPFTGPGLNHLRVSPNVECRERDIDRFFAALERARSI